MSVAPKASSGTYRIVAFAPNDWQGVWMNRQQLLSRLAHWVPVVYSTGARFVWNRGDDAGRRLTVAGSFELHDGVWLDRPPRLLMRWPRFQVWDRIALAAQAARLRRFSSSLGQGPLVGYVFNPVYADDVEALRPDICVYHAYDLFARMPQWSEEQARRERFLLKRADLVVASSDVIADALRGQGARGVVVVPNGADVESYVAAASDQSEPADLAPVPHPRIGYSGNLNRKVDFALVEHTARAHPDWQFVFVGGIGNLDAVTTTAVQRCRQAPNVHFLGRKNRTELPSYIAAMDVNIICYRVDRSLWTEGIYPLKLHEYLAAGRPVVSVDVPSVRQFSGVVALATNAREWEGCLASAIAGKPVGTLAARRAVARRNSWDVRVADLRSQLERVMASA